MKDQRGVVYFETLIGFLPVFMFFLGILQVADVSIARLVVEHAATSAARAAVVVLPDDGAYYKDSENAALHEFRDYRQSDIELAADIILEANARLNRQLTNVALDKPRYEGREIVTARVTAPYRCLVPVFCGQLNMTASARLVYQGARYKYEASTGWASSAANRGLDGVRGPRAEPNTSTTRPDGDPARPGDDSTRPSDSTGSNGNATRPDSLSARPQDPEAQRRAEQLRTALPPDLRNTPVRVDPTLEGSTVRVHYTHDDRGVITGIEIRVGPEASARHIRDHAPTVRTMQRYQGVAGRARALVQRFTSWLAGHPNAGPGSLAWESKREVEKLLGIIETRQRQLEDPNLTPEQRRELERELSSYEQQLAYHEQVLRRVTDEPGRGYVAANSAETAGRLAARERYDHDPPDPPEGYQWALRNGEPTVVRLREYDDEGQPRPSLRYDPETRKYVDIEPGHIPARKKTSPDAIAGEHPPTPHMHALARERSAAAGRVQRASQDVDRLAAELGLDVNGIDLKKADGPGQIANARADALARGDSARVATLDALLAARNDLTDARRDLTQASEKLGNAMTEDYMEKTFGPQGYSQAYPPAGPNHDPGTSSNYEPGKSGEFDYVYTKGGPPPTDIIIVEAKGGDSNLQTAKTAQERASQGTPEYLQETARKMAMKETDPVMQNIWLEIAKGKRTEPNVRYIHIEAPVHGDRARPGKVSEFDLSPRPAGDGDTSSE